MVPTVEEDEMPRYSAHLPIPWEHAEFIDDMVRYTTEFYNIPADPPDMRFGPSGFTDNIGKALLKLTLTDEIDFFEEIILDLIDECQTVFDKTRLREIIGPPFLDRFQGFPGHACPRHFLVLMAGVCKTCGMFARARRADCVPIIQAYTQTVLFPDSSYFPPLDALDLDAKEVLDTKLEAIYPS